MHSTRSLLVIGSFHVLRDGMAWAPIQALSWLSVMQAVNTGFERHVVS